MPTIETHGLTKTFRARGKTVLAVRGVDLTVPAGEIFGFLGPNGAGKTTTMRMLATLLEPTGGQARVVGYDLRKQVRLFDEMTLRYHKLRRKVGMDRGILDKITRGPMVAGAVLSCGFSISRSEGGSASDS